MLLTSSRAWALAAAVGLAAALMLFALGRGPAAVETAAAHGGASFCHGEIVAGDHGAEGTCTAPFQGFPIGVLGTYDAGEPEGGDPGHAEVHVEVFAELSTGFARPLGIECEAEGDGTASCEQSDNPFGTPLTAPEPAPAEIVGLSCRAHSHAHVSADATPSGEFACWSTDEARAALAEEGFGEPGGGDPEPEPEPEPDPAPGGGGAGSFITTVPIHTYLPDTVVVDRSLGLTYMNFDASSHDVVATEATRPDGSAEWCDSYAAGSCPLFWTPLLSAGGQAPVQGIEDAEAGQSYAFHCSLHPYMTGTIEVAN